MGGKKVEELVVKGWQLEVGREDDILMCMFTVQDTRGRVFLQPICDKKVSQKAEYFEYLNHKHA